MGGGVSRELVPLDLSAGYMGVFNLWRRIKLYVHFSVCKSHFSKTLRKNTGHTPLN